MVGSFTLVAGARREHQALPAREFALPGQKYPVEDARHAANARARASQQFTSGKLSAADRAQVDRKANAGLRRNR